MKVIVYFSGGVDSLAALLWSVRVYGNENVVALHAILDTEIPTISEYVDEIVTLLDVELIKISNNTSLLQSFYDRDIPFFANPWCKKEFIHKPLNLYVKNHYSPDNSLVVFGGNKKEKVDKLLNSDGTFRKPNRTFYDRFTGIKKYPTIQPFFYWTKNDVIQFLKSENIKMWNGYDKGFVRTACWICPFQSQKQLVALYNNLPDKFDLLKEFEKSKGYGIRSHGDRIIDFAVRGINKQKKGDIDIFFK